MTASDLDRLRIRLDEPRDEPNFDLFWSFGLDFFSDDELLSNETDSTEQKETTEQTEIGQQ